MRFDKKIIKVVTLIAIFLVVLALVLVALRAIVGNDKEYENIPSPNQIIYGISYLGEVGYDIGKLNENLFEGSNYLGYELGQNYKMIYQITNEENELETKNYLGISSSLPEINYEEKYLLLSAGYRVSDIKNNSNKEDENRNSIMEIEYDTSEYFVNTVFVYTMNPVEVLSGEALEAYYWENALSECNLVEQESQKKELVDSGTHFKVYSRPDGIYEYNILSGQEKIAVRRGLSAEKPIVEEFSDTLIKVDLGSKNFYYNSVKNIFSIDYEFKTGFLVYDIVTYMRVKDGEIQLILRDAYDDKHYAKIIRLPFTDDKSDLDALLKSVKVVDSTTVTVEYYKGDDRTLTTENVEIYNINRY